MYVLVKSWLRVRGPGIYLESVLVKCSICGFHLDLSSLDLSSCSVNVSSMNACGTLAVWAGETLDMPRNGLLCC